MSDIAWARTADWRDELAGRWPAIATQEIAIRGPRAEAALLRGWLASRLEREVPSRSRRASSACGSTARRCAPRTSEPRTPSDLLSAELDRFARDRIYEQAARRRDAERSALGKRRDRLVRGGAALAERSEAPGAGGSPAKVVQRPPASSTISCTAA